MSAEVRFDVVDHRGEEILDALEERTGVLPFKVGRVEIEKVDGGEWRDTDRTYYLSSADAGVDGFDAALERIDSTWREHLRRTP